MIEALLSNKGLVNDSHLECRLGHKKVSEWSVLQKTSVIGWHLASLGVGGAHDWWEFHWKMDILLDIGCHVVELQKIIGPFDL